MGVKYAPLFDLRALRFPGLLAASSFSMTLASADLTSVTITPSDFTTYDANSAPPITWHNDQGYPVTASQNHDGVAMFQGYLDLPLANAIAAIANAKIAAASPTPWTGESLAFGFANGVYTATGTVAFSITWNNSASRSLMGFSSNTGAATSHTGTLRPTYWIESTQDGRSIDREGDYEIGPIAAQSISDSATVSAGVSRSTAAKYREWVQQFEPVSGVLKGRRTGSRPFTFESLFEHCRADWPFLVDDGVERMVCKFTAEGSVFSGKQRAGGVDDDVSMHVPFRVWHAADLVIGG